MSCHDIHDRSITHYFSAACGHKHDTPMEAAICVTRGSHGGKPPQLYPVNEVTIRQGRITLTRTVMP